MVFFPLAPTHLLVLKYPELKQDPSIVPTKKIDIDAGSLQDGHISLDFNMRLEAEMVIATNKVLVELADRYVVATSRSVRLGDVANLTI